MKLHLNLSLRRALLATFAAASTLVSAAYGGVVDERYDLQYYLDFARNKGMFSAGATDIAVFFKDGTSIRNNVIPLMPSFDSYGQTVTEIVSLPGMTPRIATNGGTNLVSAQFVYGAKHVHAKIGNTPVAFLSEDGSSDCLYYGANLDTFGHDSSLQRLTKLVTSVAYTPMADDAFMSTISTNSTWIYRLGNGGAWSAGESIMTKDNALGGVVNLSIIRREDDGDWYMEGWARYEDTNSDARTPLDIGTYFGDSGSPSFVWDDKNNRFVFIAAMWASGVQTKLPNWYLPSYNPSQAIEVMDKYTVTASFSGTDTILWGTQDASSGKGTLSQVGSEPVGYTGLGTANSIADTLGLTFSTTGENEQTLQLQGNVNMGAGALTFENGKWRLTELDGADFTLHSAGFDIRKGAEVTWELTGSSDQEIRKVGEGTLTISGTGNNESTLVVGGGTTVYNVTKDENGNITGCTLGNVGETRLNRTGGYAASSVRLEGGVAIVVLMEEGQFKKNSVDGDTFTFGNDGGLLNLNGHSLSWGVINQQDSGKGARIGNFTPLGEERPGDATFTYTGTGTFDGCFMDEGAEGAKLGVVYNNATEGATWTLTGNHSNAGGFTVQAGTMVLQGTNTPHVMMTDSADWTYASIQGANVAVQSNATFQLSHHALMEGNVTVESGGTFVINQTVNAASESISGSLRQDMAKAGITTLIGNVTLNGAASMVVSTNSPVTTTMKGNILSDTSGMTDFASFTKTGNGIFVIDGQLKVVMNTVESGGLVVKSPNNFVPNWAKWKILEQGFLAVENIENEKVLASIDPNGAFGVLALTKNQETALDLSLRSNLIIGAWGDISYGTESDSLATVYDSASDRNVWRLGGGTGTLTVNFKLSGDNDLLIGNEYSSGTVHLANTNNDFAGKIVIQGLGNILTFEDGALGNAKVALPYGNAMSLYNAAQFAIIDASSSGVLALATNDADFDMRNKTFSLGAFGDLTYTGNITVSDKYRFGGTGNLTLDTALDGAASMEVDAQGMSGSSVTFARQNAFTGDIVIGSALHMEERNSVGDIAVHAGHEESLAAVSSIEFQKGSVLYTDGQNLKVSNLSMQEGSRLINNGESDSHLNLAVDATKSTYLADGVLISATDTPDIHITKTGDGTLAMGYNSSWSGGLTISEGTVECDLISTGWGYSTSGGGIGTEGNTIHIQENGTLRINAVKQTGRKMGGTEISQRVSGTGTIEFSSGGAALFSSQEQNFEGLFKLVDNTRLYLGSKLDVDGGATKNTVNALKHATIEVTAGSQVRITSALNKQYAERVNVYSDFILNGSGYNGARNDGEMKYIDTLPGGALSIDFGSTVFGDITLASNAAISSISGNLGGNGQQCTNQQYYGIQGYLGGTIRGRILGVEQNDGTISALSITGNEGITITADSANTYGDLNIVNSGTCRNSDEYALRLDNGAARSQTSTALGLGTVQLNGGLILRLAGTGVENNSDVVYTYTNAMNVGADATIQSYNITNRLTGTVTMTGNSLNLTTAQGGVLELAGGISGNGTLNIGADSRIIIGSAAAGTDAPQFSGSVVTQAGADITLSSASVVSNTTTFTGTDSLSLHLGGTADYTLGGISVGASGETASTLNLSFDFTGIPDTEQADTWTTLTSSISAGNTVIDLELNMFDDISKGSYTLITRAGNSTYSLADDMNGRLSLTTNDDNALVLTVGNDNRLFWRSGGDGTWTGTNWYSDEAGGKTTFSTNANIMLNAEGVATGNSATSRETIILASDQTAGTIGAQQAAYEITGSGSLTATRLTVGNGGDLKLSNTDGSTFTNGVLVSGAGSKLESGVNMTANIRAENRASYAQTGGTLTGNLHLENADAAIQNATMAGNITTAGSGKLTLNTASTGGSSRTFSFDAGTLTAAANGIFSGTFTYTQDQTTLQAGGMSLSYCNVTSTAALDVDKLSMTGCQIMLNHAADTTTNIDTITGNGSLNKNSAGNLNLVNANLWGMTLIGGGTTTIAGIVNITNDPLSVGKETLNLVNSANVTVTRLTAGNTSDNQPSQININTGASLTITGNNDTDTTSNSCLLAHWKNSASTLVLNGGSLNIQNSSLLMGWDSSGRFEVLSGTANLKGIRFSSQRSNADTLILGSAENGSGRINLGSGGITGIGNNDTVSLGNGTIGALADYAINGHKEINLIGTNNGTCFDTAGYTVTVNTALAGAGNMIKAGSGTLLLAGNGTAFSGNITVQEGSLAITQEGKSVLESASSVIIDGGTLDISRLNLSGTDDAIRIASGQTFILSDNASINFGNISANTEYHIFDFSSGLVDGWSSDNLTAEEIIIGGVKLSDMGRGANYSISMDGFFSYTLLGDRVVKWNGGTTPSSWTQASTVTSWINTSGANESTAFVNFDSVAFESDADLTLEGNIHVDNLTVAEGVSLKTAGQLTVHGAMTLGNGFNWDFSGNTTLSFTEATLKTAGKIVVGDGATLVMTNKTTGQDNTSTAFDHVSGTGHIILNLGADNGVGFNLGEFSGDVTVATGRLQVNTSTFNDASTIYLSTSGSQLVFNATSELKNDVVLGADTTFHVNTPKNGLYTGTISGDLLGEDRKLTKAGGSILTLKGRTTLKTLETKAGQVIIDSPYALIEMVDGAIGDAATGNLKLAEGASLRVTGDVWSRSNTGILVERGAELALLKHEICIINTNGEETSLKATTSNGQLYSLANSNYEIKNARVVFTGSESATLGNKLTNVTLENSISNAVAPANLEDGADDTVYAGSKLTVTHAENTLNGVIAYGGDIALHNLQSETELNLLEIAAGKTVSAYVGDATDECSTVKVTESLLLSGSSTLNASLTLADGATLEMTGLEDTNAAVVNGALTFEGSVTLGNQLLASVEALECGDSLTLFIGLSSLTLPDEADLNDGMGLSANTLFSNVQDTNLYVNYHMVGDVGSLSIAYIPEPTTSTLSLLALAGLCARRRRK